MTNVDINNSGVEGDIPQRAVSLYGQGDAVDDFPVLKAFQQYINAEQEKSRKRMITLSIFFGVALIVVIVVFMVLLQSVSMRNQALSDRLVEYAMKESDRRQEDARKFTAQQPSANDAALKAMTETLTALQKKLEKKEEPKPAVISTQQSEQLRNEQSRIDRAKQKLEEERKQIAEEKKRLHEMEIDRQRRKLYPELYEDRSKQPTRQSRREISDDDIRDILRDAYADESEVEDDSQESSNRRAKRIKRSAGTSADAVESTKAKRKTIDSKERATEKIVDEDDDSEDEEPMEAIEYFKDDEYKIPVDVKGSSVKFTLPVK